MSIYLRKITLVMIAMVVALGFSSGAFAQGKGKGGGHGNGNGHGNGGGNGGGGGWVQRGGGGGNGNGGGGGGNGNGNGWGRVKQENRGGGGFGVQQARPQQVYRQPQPVYRQPQQVYQQPQKVYRQPQQVYRQPQPVYRQQPQVWAQDWKQERRAEKWKQHSEADRGRGFFNPRPMENFYRQQQRREDKDARKQQREFEKSWRRAEPAPLAFDQRNWRRGDDDNDDRGERFRRLRESYSQPYRQYYPQPYQEQYYQPYTYRQYYQPNVYQPYSYQYPTTQYYYQSSPYYGYNSYYPSYYSGVSGKEMIIRSIISSVFGGSPLGGLGGVSSLFGNDPYYADNGYYNYNGYYYNQPVYDFYQQTACYPTAYLSDYSPVYYSGPTYYSDYYPTYTTGYYPSYYSTYYSPVSYYDYNDYGIPYDYAGYGYGNSLLSLIPGGGKLDRATGGVASQILLATLGSAYGRGYDDALYYDDNRYRPQYTRAAYLPASLPSSLRTGEARQIFDQGYELGYRDALAQRDPYGRLDLVSSFLGQSIGL